MNHVFRRLVEQQQRQALLAMTPPIPAFPPPCKCSHAESLHYRDRKGRPTCGIAVCGCIQFRPKESA